MGMYCVRSSLDPVPVLQRCGGRGGGAGQGAQPRLQPRHAELLATRHRGHPLQAASLAAAAAAVVVVVVVELVREVQDGRGPGGDGGRVELVQIAVQGTH